MPPGYPSPIPGGPTAPPPGSWYTQPGMSPGNDYGMPGGPAPSFPDDGVAYAGGQGPGDLTNPNNIYAGAGFGMNPFAGMSREQISLLPNDPEGRLAWLKAGQGQISGGGGSDYGMPGGPQWTITEDEPTIGIDDPIGQPGTIGAPDPNWTGGPGWPGGRLPPPPGSRPGPGPMPGLSNIDRRQLLMQQHLARRAAMRSRRQR
jgi:hypothetical protein